MKEHDHKKLIVAFIVTVLLIISLALAGCRRSEEIWKYQIGEEVCLMGKKARVKWRDIGGYDLYLVNDLGQVYQMYVNLHDPNLTKDCL